MNMNLNVNEINIIINDTKNMLETYKTFRLNDAKQLKLTIVYIFKKYIEDNIITFSSPDFDKNLIKYMNDILVKQLKPAYSQNCMYRIKYKLDNLIKRTINQLYLELLPRRSYKTSFVRKLKFNGAHLTEKVNILLNAYQPAQRTEAWYVFRHNLLTASSIWKALGTQSSQNQLIYEKCQPHTIYKNAPITSPLHWGQKYEPVSVELYKKLYDTEITDFGCIQHPKYPFIGASPDGINTDITNLRYARMLEIKNIVNRVINGIPKVEYWIQMQVQMETCNLNECDFLETRFVEYNNEAEFLLDGTFTHTEDNKLKGIMILFSDDKGSLIYEYAPLYITPEDYLVWEEEILNKHSDHEWIQNIFWRLDQYSNILVLRNKLWFAEALKKIAELWQFIEKERITGYEHRAPKKRKTAASTLFMKNECYITVEKL